MTRMCPQCETPSRPGRGVMLCAARSAVAKPSTGSCGRLRGFCGSRPPAPVAYADPPYPGKAWLYRDHPDYGGEVNHPARLAMTAGPCPSAEALPAVPCRMHDAWSPSGPHVGCTTSVTQFTHPAWLTQVPCLSGATLVWWNLRCSSYAVMPASSG